MTQERVRLRSGSTKETPPARFLVPGYQLFLGDPRVLRPDVAYWARIIMRQTIVDATGDQRPMPLAERLEEAAARIALEIDSRLSRVYGEEE